MTSDRKQPGVAFWATVVVVVALVAYPLSFGPYFWIVNHIDERRADFLEKWMDRIYAPLDWLLLNGPQPISDAILRYAALWGDHG